MPNPSVLPDIARSAKCVLGTYPASKHWPARQKLALSAHHGLPLTGAAGVAPGWHWNLIWSLIVDSDVFFSSATHVLSLTSFLLHMRRLALTFSYRLALVLVGLSVS